MNKKLILAVLIAFVGSCLFGGLRTFAVDKNNIKSMMVISPPVQKIVLTPGEVYEGSIKVSSSGKESKELKYSARIGSFSLRDDENGNTDYNNTDVDTITGYNQIMNWIKLEKESGVVASNSTDVLTYTITVPEDAPAGGQYASIIIRDDTETNNEGENGDNIAIQNVIEFAATLIAEVAGNTRDEGVVLENNIPTFLLNNNLEATSMVRNNGNVHTDAEYILQVWPLFSGEEICTNEENPGTSLIMPETERYHTESCQLPAVGIFRAKQTVKIFGEESIVEKTIIVCPIWLLFIIIFVVFALIFYFITKSKARKKAAKTSQTK